MAASENQREMADDGYAGRLLRALSTASSAGIVSAATTHQRLLEVVVQTAANVIGARSSALFLIDEEAEELIFEVALGPKGVEVKNLRVPLGHGIAGLVAVTGQAIAISDAASDPRQARDISAKVEYQPETILAVPLLSGDQVTGVLELLDKESGVFTPHDINVLGQFAKIAAIAIEQSLTHRNLGRLVRSLLEESAGEAGGGAQTLAEIEQDRSYTAAIDLATLVQDIAWRGDAERETCVALLEGFRSYLDQRRPSPASARQSP